MRIWARFRNTRTAEMVHNASDPLIHVRNILEHMDVSSVARTRRALRATHCTPFYLSATYTHIRRHNGAIPAMRMHLYFICPPDVDGVESEPLLGSAGTRPEACWTTLSINRQRETGVTESAATLEQRMTAQGYRVHPYTLEPLEPIPTPEVEVPETPEQTTATLTSVLIAALDEPEETAPEEEEESEEEEEESEEEDDE